MEKIIFTLTFIVSLSTCLIAQPGSVDQKGSVLNNHSSEFNTHLLERAYDTSACGLNYVQATSLITTRYNQYSQSSMGHGFPDTLSISGLPNSYSIAKAFIYFIESYTTSCQNPIVTLNDLAGNSHDVGATLVGMDGPACWGETGTYGFRADVTDLITGNGNYVIDSISCSSVWEIDGASLLVVYQDLNANYRGTIDIYDGCKTVDGGSDSTKITGFNVCQHPVYGRGFVISGDFQDNVGPHKIIINNDTFSFPSLFMNFDDTTASYNVGQITSIMGATSPGDCYIHAVAGVYYRDTCIVCPLVITGEKEIELSDFIVNPNPTEGLLNISTAKGFNKTINLSLVNVLGEEVIKQTWNPSMSRRTTALDIQNYSKGVYFLMMQSGERKIYLKIVKE